MTTLERKSMIVRAIRKLETKLVVLAHCEADCDKSMIQRDAEIEVVQEHLHAAHSVLVSINEEELGIAA